MRVYVCVRLLRTEPSMRGMGGLVVDPLVWRWKGGGFKIESPLASASSDMIGWSGVLLSRTLDAARSY